MTPTPFDALVGGEPDTVSFIRDYVELRIGYSIVRLLTDPSGEIDRVAWRLTDADGADSLRRFIGRTVVAVGFDEHDHLRLSFSGDAYIAGSLRDEDRSGPEALHLLPADAQGRVHSATMSAW
jgi:hypothetical protein